MRAIGLSDLDLAARALMCVPASQQRAVAARLLEDADVCDRWRRRFGTIHPSGGTGSLYAQAALGAVTSVSTVGPDYIAAFQVVLQAVSDWRTRHGTDRYG